MSDHILTTHAGSLPRPDDLADMMWTRAGGGDVSPSALEARIDEAVDEVVARQRDVGIDVVSDGELSKTGFATYVGERFSGFDGVAEFRVDDLADFPNVAARVSDRPSSAHTVFSYCVAPVRLADRDAIHRDVARLIRSLDRSGAERGFLGTVSPGQISFSYPNRYYGSHEEYLAAIAAELAYEYRAIADAGLQLQVDSPDMAMAAHCRMLGSSVGDWQHHLPLAVDALNAALEGIPPEQVRLHLCWGNYPGPHHHDIPLADVIGEALRVNAGTIYVEGANPRHEHEWRVFEEIGLPEDKSMIVGVVDVKTNCVEHPRVVADRLVRIGRIVGRERLLAGTDCGFGTSIRSSVVDPDIAWLKLRSLTEGAQLASAEL